MKSHQNNKKMNKNPTIAIIGRPNVGKSTFFNRLAGRRIAIVHDRPGVTRDRRSLEIDFFGCAYTFIDTPGLYDPEVDSVPDQIKNGMKEQAFKALDEADLICFMIDGRKGCTPYDFSLAKDLRHYAKKVIIIVNKSEGNHGIQGISDAAMLGLSNDIIPFSAEHGEGLTDLAECLGKHFKNYHPSVDPEKNSDSEDRPISFTIMGRPNVGKSTLFNTLINKDQQLTGDLPGLTRDSIDYTFEYKGKAFKLIDTAGIRRRSKIYDVVEKLAVVDAKKALQYTEVVVLLIDGSLPFDHHLEKQDLNLAQTILEEGRALILGINKWDLVKDKKKFLDHIKNELTYKLSQAPDITIVPFSALEKNNCNTLLDQCLNIYKQWNQRISTGKLNDWFEYTVNQHMPPIIKGQRIRLKYITQIKTRPPSFVIFGTKNLEIPDSYHRYLVNRLREDFNLKSVPIRLHFKSPKNPYIK